MGYCFSGSRLIELFEALLRPLFERDAIEADAQLGRDVLERPDLAFARGGVLHERYRKEPASERTSHTPNSFPQEE